MTAQSSAITSATTKILVSTTLPATFDQAGYAALTWIPIAEVTSLGAFGGKTTVVKHIVLDTATVVKRSGSVDYGTINCQLAKHTGADMTALTTAFSTRASTAFKVAYPTALATNAYFTGIVTSLQVNVGTADAILQSTIDIELDSPIIEGT